jgi:serine/threonine protein kinase
MIHSAVNGTSTLENLLEECAGRLEAGEAVDVAAFAAAHPEHADQLRRVLPTMLVLAELGRLASAGGAVPPSTGADAEPAAGVLGDFRIIREVGRGGMGVVYEAEQVSLGRRVALKVLPFAATLDSRQLQRFHNEARAAAGLHHTNIVPVYAVGQERGVHYYAMQFIDGRTLADLIAEKRCEVLARVPTVPERGAAAASASTIPPAAQATSAAPRETAEFRRAAEWGIQAAEALDYAHSLGVVHRDVKPANLLVDAAGRLWVTDFGLAQVQSGAGLTVTGDLVGTLRYMSPEQALAKRVVIDHRTDVYSLGATLYELLTLHSVFGGNDRQELLRQIAFEEPRPPRRVERTVPAELEVIVQKALEKNPADRYATAQELADDLRRWLEDRPIRARRPTAAQRAAKWCKRHLALTLSAVAALIAVTAISSVSAALLLAAYRSEKDANQAEKEQRQTAEEERKRADANFRRSVEEFTELLKVVNGGDVSGPPEIDNVRQAQANRVIKFSQELLKENRADPEGRLQTGLAYGALWQAYLGLEEYAQAADMLALEIETFEELAADFPDDARSQRALTGARALGPHFLVDHVVNGGKRLVSAGKCAKAAQAYRAALSASEKYRLEEDEDKMMRAHLAYGLAQALRALGRSAEAEEPCTLAAYHCAKIIADDSEGVYLPWCQLSQAGACTLRGLIRADLGRTAEAEADFRQAIALTDALALPIRRAFVTDITNQPQAHHALGNLLWAADRREEASEEYRLAERGWRDEPRNARSNSCLAWLLAVCPDAQLRKPDEAVQLAKQATTFPAWPDARPWQALGAALYRAGDAKEAMAALEKSRQVNDGGDGIDFFLLAMACWKQGAKDQARHWHDEVVRWMEKSRPHDPELVQLRAESAALLGVGQKQN